MYLKIKMMLLWTVSLGFIQTLCAQELSYVNYVHIPPGASQEKIIELAANLTPSPRQFNWQQMELIAFIHFGINTFTDKEWGDGAEDPQLFNPSQLDAEQWVLACKNAGFRLIILTAKHHDGFCLWPSRFTEHSVKNSPWKNGQGDVVKELAEACRKHDMKFGVYLSPWDRNSPYFGTDEYNDYFVNQLTELLTNYGEISEVWLDGANGEGPNGKKQVYDEARWFAVIRKLQPDAVIAISGPDVRWVGTETGYGKETEWSMRAATLKNRAELDEQSPKEAAFIIESSSPGILENITQNPSLVWYPVETDVSIRPGWFYHSEENDRVKTPDELFDIYCSSVGRNGALLLNIPPDTRGLIHDKDIESLVGFKNKRTTAFADNLLSGASVSRVESTMTKGLISNALILEYTLPEAITFDLLQLQENIRVGQRIESFKLEYEDGGAWKEITRGTTVGYKRILRFDPVSAKYIRLTIESSRLIPELSEVGLYRQTGSDTDSRKISMDSCFFSR
ncbi:MAG: alpha-L-fucosidase [Candidatus Azobacteroides sp.]|nr:alpha-L-fucosidase [Candidatus Azobacteroides sp.]